MDELAVREVRRAASSFGLPERLSLRSMRTGTTTRQPFSASRLANGFGPLSSFVSPAICSGVQVASGIATTFAITFPFGSSSSPSPSTPGSTAHRTAYTGVRL